MNVIKRRDGRSARAAHSRGFTLVESLVSMVVISVGMLGIAALYVEGLRAGRSSIYQSIAIDLASDMADRIRANPTAGVAYAGPGPGVNRNCVAAGINCTPVQLAEDDTWWWHQSVPTLLPAGQANVAVVAGGVNSAYTITVSWSEPGFTQRLDYVLSVQL
jgi:type IV pilus assembly protein PilV